MESGKVNTFMATKGKYFPANMTMAIRSQLEKLDDNKLGGLQSLPFKNPTTILIISILIGGFGIDRFMLGQVGLGILKLITFGGFFFWWFIDLFLVSKTAKEKIIKYLCKMQFKIIAFLLLSIFYKKIKVKKH